MGKVIDRERMEKKLMQENIKKEKKSRGNTSTVITPRDNLKKDGNGREKSAHKATSYSLKFIRFLFKHHQAKELSYAYRKEIKDKMDDAFLTYGEVDPSSFLQILSVSNNFLPLDGKVFYDLGSGSGLACITAALSSYSFESIHGIEIVPSLAALSNSILDKLKTTLTETPAAKKALPPKPPKQNPTIVDLVPIIDKILDEGNGICIVEQLANRLCKEVGHKQYRAAMKKHSSFVHYLKQNDTKYKLSEDNKEISLVQKGSEIEQLSGKVESVEIVAVPGEEEDELTKSEEIESLDPAIQDFYRDRLPEIELVEGDIFAIPWWESADVVYVASLLFSEEMMRQLSLLTLRMKNNAVFITLKPLVFPTESTDGPAELVHESFFKMSWQMAKVFIYRIIHRPALVEASTGK